MTHAVRGNKVNRFKCFGFNRALTMPEDERTLRMNHLRRRERIYDVNYWMKSFLQVMGSLEEHDSVGATTMQPVTMDDFDDYLSK